MEPIAAEHARMGVLPDAHRLIQEERLRLQLPDFMIPFIADINDAGVRMHGDASQEHVLGERIRLHLTLQRSFAMLVSEDVDDSRVAAADIELFAVGAKCQTVESFL
jgi:hypothetical protein